MAASSRPNRAKREPPLRAARLSRSVRAATPPTVGAIRFEPIHTRRAFEEICQRIRDQLLAGALQPGDKLPAERELSRQLGVGRNALREALRSLEIAGILRLQKGVKGGAFVREGDAGRMDQVLRDMLSLGSFTVAELTEARMHILDLVVRLALDRATAADLDALAANIDRTEVMTAEGRFLDRVECSRNFYRLLAGATRNQVLAMMVHALNEILMQFVYAHVAGGGKPKPRLVESRREFLSALRSGDADEAARLMRAHLVSLHRMLQARPHDLLRRPSDLAGTQAQSRGPRR